MRERSSKTRPAAAPVTLAALGCLLWAQQPPAAARRAAHPQGVQREGDGEAAGRAFDEAVRLHGEGSPKALERAAEKYEEAIRLWRAAGDGLKEARATNNLAAVHQARGGHAKALALFERALALFEKSHGPDHVEVAKTLNNIANLYHSTGEHEKAEPYQDRSADVFVRALGPDDPNAAESLRRLAEQYAAAGKSAKAVPL